MIGVYLRRHEQEEIFCSCAAGARATSTQGPRVWIFEGAACAVAVRREADVLRNEERRTEGPRGEWRPLEKFEQTESGQARGRRKGYRKEQIGVEVGERGGGEVNGVWSQRVCLRWRLRPFPSIFPSTLHSRKRRSGPDQFDHTTTVSPVLPPPSHAQPLSIHLPLRSLLPKSRDGNGSLPANLANESARIPVPARCHSSANLFIRLYMILDRIFVCLLPSLFSRIFCLPLLPSPLRHFCPTACFTIP